MVLLSLSALLAACAVHAALSAATCDEAPLTASFRASNLDVRKFIAETGDARCMAFSPEGGVVATGHWNGSVKLWNVVTGRRIRAFKAHASVVLGISFDNAGARLLTASADKSAALWSATAAPKEGLPLHRLEGHGGWVVSAAFGHGDDAVITGSGDKIAKLWNTSSGEMLRSLPEHNAALLSVALSPDGRLAFTSAGDNSTRLWDVATGLEQRQLKGHRGWVVSSSFSPAAETLLTSSHDNSAQLWGMPAGRRLQSFEGIGDVLSAALSPDGRLVLTGTREGLATVWDADTGAPLRNFKDRRGDPYIAVAFNGDGSKVLLGSLKKGKPRHMVEAEEEHTKCEARCAAEPQG